MKTLAHDRDLTDIVGRLQRLDPQAVRQWGVMSPHQMICHLVDANRMALGELPMVPRTRWPKTVLLKALGLYAPMTWPRGLVTTPELDQTRVPASSRSFEESKRAVIQSTRALAGRRGNWPRHPIFGRMTRGDWLRWGYLHNDHHLRQFGL